MSADIVHINQFAIKGEPGTGYEGPDGGRFNCDNCEYYRPSDSSCGQSDMQKKSKRPRTAEGRVRVDAKGCCEYVDREGNEKGEREGDMSKLSAAERRALPDSAFAGPNRSYPVEDAGHAKAALGRLGGKSKSVQSQVRSKVKKRYGYGGQPMSAGSDD